MKSLDKEQSKIAIKKNEGASDAVSPTHMNENENYRVSQTPGTEALLSARTPRS
jgi:hypothetical protein